MAEKLELFYVRHADVVGGDCEERNPSDRDLSELGERQLPCIAERFAGRSFDAVISSPMVRCVRTAAAIANRLETPPVIELMPELIEKGTPTGYIGQSTEYLTRYYPKLTRCPDLIYGGPQQIFLKDDKQDALNRANAVVAYLRNRFGYGKRVLLVSHACFGISFLQAAVGITDEAYAQYRTTMANTSVSKVKFTDDGVIRISFQNDTSHLRGLDPDIDFNI